MAFAGESKLSTLAGFIVGGSASMSAAACTHPLDVLKVRLQVSGEGVKGKTTSLGSEVRNIWQTRGIPGFYQGLSGSLLRQATYSTTRFGAYPPIKRLISGGSDKPLSFVKKIMAGIISGGLGALVGTPADLVMVRMQADGKKPLAERNNYKNVFDGIYRISKESGPLSLWRGCTPTVVRAMLVTAGQLASYDQFKQIMLSYKFKDNVFTHTVASVAAGFIATVLTNPVDTAKTRIMVDKLSGDAKYKNMFQAMYVTARGEGLMALYKGFWPTFMRLCPQTTITMLFYEQIARLWILTFGEKK
eukprot:TRINITY_DN793_c0_g1_i1.p1 TRINITY_DN793_c0_g1~~TRINITY_DN793_c0_g1_i1.p1  ORF type:complete len:303 (-),score=42.09 TRINITY_DN793_c0_g1_i1:54-962(-)